MKRSVALLLVLPLLTALCLIAIKPAFSTTTAAEDTWTSLAPMQQARGGLGVTVVDGKIYAIGGSIARGSYRPDTFAGGYVGTNEMYDPETNTWTSEAHMPTPRAHFAIVAYQSKIYCIGGAIDFSVDERTGFYSSIVSGVTEVYDTITDTWSTKKSLPNEAMKIQAHVVNGKIYVMQGSQPYAYDPEEDLWSYKTRMPPPYPKSSSVSAVVDNKIIVTAEFAVEPYYVSEQKVLIYDTENDRWSGGKSGPIVVASSTAGATVGSKAPQRIYVLGLEAPSPRSIFVNQVYDPKADTWSSATPMPTNRTDFGIAVIDDSLYAIGGYTRSSSYYVSPTNAHDQYIPIGYGTIHPKIEVVEPQKKIYNTSSVFLAFTIDKTTSWIGYSLDGLDNVTIIGNHTIVDLAEGLHNLTIYAMDSFSNIGVSETVNFTIDLPEFFPTTLAIAATLIATVFGAGLILNLVKQRRRRSQKT
jgi:N-acetylneuraminic acid mutarotase